MIIYDKPFDTRVVDQDNESYHSEDCYLSSSMIKNFIESPLVFKTRYHQEVKQTDSMLFGSLVHEAILEPSKFIKRQVLPEFGDLRLKKNKDLKNDFLLNSLPGPSISKEHSDKIKQILNNLDKNEFNHLLDNTKKEQSIFVHDHQHKLGLKARPDAFNETILLDIKTIQRISSETKMEWTVRDYSYHYQLAFYQRVLNLSGFDPSHFYILFVENEAPFDTKFIEISPDFMRKSFLELDGYLSDFKYCDQNNYWCGKQTKTVPMLFRSLA